MELVRATSGQLPRGRRAIHGGHEEDGRILYHAVATIGGLLVAGKTGEHLVSSNSVFTIWCAYTQYLGRSPRSLRWSRVFHD